MLKKLADYIKFYSNIVVINSAKKFIKVNNKRYIFIFWKFDKLKFVFWINIWIIIFRKMKCYNNVCIFSPKIVSIFLNHDI